MKDTIDHEHRTLRFERVLSAPPDDVFDAWTRPARVTDWWDPTGAPLAQCTIDPRVGGAFRFVTVGHAPPFEGTYEVVDRPHRLVFVAMGARGTITFEAQGERTLMKVAIESPSAEHFETFVKLGVAAGTSVTLDNLARALARRREASATA